MGVHDDGDDGDGDGGGDFETEQQPRRAKKDKQVRKKPAEKKKRKAREEWSDKDVLTLVRRKKEKMQNIEISREMTAVGGRDNVAINNKWKQLRNLEDGKTDDEVYARYLGKEVEEEAGSSEEGEEKVGGDVDEEEE